MWNPITHHFVSPFHHIIYSGHHVSFASVRRKLKIILAIHVSFKQSKLHHTETLKNMVNWFCNTKAFFLKWASLLATTWMHPCNFLDKQYRRTTNMETEPQCFLLTSQPNTIQPSFWAQTWLGRRSTSRDSTDLKFYSTMRFINLWKKYKDDLKG